MVMKDISTSSIEFPAFMPWMESIRIKDLVEELSAKHHFDLGRPGYVLWLKAPDDETDVSWGDLAICVSGEGFTLGFCRPQRAGFRMHYSRNWVPMRAFNNDGCPYRNLSRANEEMFKLVRRFRGSDSSLVTNWYRVKEAPAVSLGAR